jgi:ADP-ribose pyrophosphatase
MPEHPARGTAAGGRGADERSAPGTEPVPAGAQAADGPRDEVRAARVVTSAVLHRGRIWDLASDDVELGGGQVVVREYVRHPGAVAVIALDDEDRVLLLQQYRHPVRSFLWEPPAGLLDAEGEDLRDAAARELAEEADLRAERWAVLVDYYTSPGSSDEAIRVFLARGLSPVPEHQLHERQDEEHGMAVLWVPLDEAVAAVLGGRVHNPSSVVGILAAARARDQGWRTLRPLDAPWVR